MNKIIIAWAAALMIGGTSLANIEIARLQSDQIEIEQVQELMLPSEERATPRSKAAVRAFRRIYVCPSTGAFTGACSGYVVDHIKPLCAGGADHFTNMQWQTVEAAKEKDRWEWQECAHLRQLVKADPPPRCSTPEGKEEPCANRARH